ncbi:MAG: 2-dehydropantoate 2-reductase [Ignavibacteria bacterium]|nr:2-dehydropantoate 2-reductase [Ignavibacteria bacterium]MCC7158087.1 2-dehydropantoate 2-reductase [Ignavibacteria bacterium]
MENPENISAKPLKIAVVGLGPVGIILAVHLKEAGFEVAVCDKDKIKINLIRNEGVKLEGAISKQAYFENIYTDVLDLKKFDPDLLVFALKTYQTLDSLTDAVKLDNEKLKVMCAQNGIDSELMFINAFGESKTLRLVINFAGNLNAPNIVKVSFFNPPNYLASMDDSHIEFAQMISDRLTEVFLDTKTLHSFEILKRIWEKTILNSALSPLCGIGKLTLKEAMEIPDSLELIEVVIQEAVEVAEAEKIKFEDDFIRKCMRYLRKAGHHYPSLAVDLINNRPTEIDFMNGKIVEYGQKHYIRTSLNLALANMVKAMSFKTLQTNLTSVITFASTGDSAKKRLVNFDKARAAEAGDCYLGIDLGSAFMKFAVIDEDENILFDTVLKTANRDRIALKHVLEAVNAEYRIKYSCATGYGRKHFPDAEMIKTEINCAASAVSAYFPGEKNIIDIGGEDIKIIKCDGYNSVDSFYMNDKCAAGTGSFLTEIAEKADIKVSEMSNLASKSKYNVELNSFCTVFAKTEIMGWLYNGIPIDDISRGIYLSLANKIARLRVDPTIPTYVIGGVIAHHPYLKALLSEKLKHEVHVVEKPQFMVAFGAALTAKQHFLKSIPTDVIEEHT